MMISIRKTLPDPVCIAGEVTASQALVSACEECIKVSQHMRGVFDNALDHYKQQNPDWNKKSEAPK